jgi:prophage tail gpP-like protein
MSSRDQLTLRIGGLDIQGWTEVRVTRGVERVPGDFEITMTERFPGDLNAVVMMPGQPCQVLLGDDVVITGYVDRFAPSISARGHQIRVSGRGACCDLVDCSAEWPGGQISGTNALDVAQKLAQPYGIAVALAAGISAGGNIPQFNLILGETAWEVIERVCRYRALLAYELANGSLVLNQVGTDTHSSGFALGQNVQEASVQYGMDQRYSDYVAFIQSVETFNNSAPGTVDPNQIVRIRDNTVLRHRQMDIIAEAAAGGVDIAAVRAQWEMGRRWGRSFVCSLTADSWRDSSGQLWQPNWLVDLDLPQLKLLRDQWVISEVSYELDRSGTTARLTMMPPAAFQPQPVLLQPQWLMELSGGGFQFQGGNTGWQTVGQIGAGLTGSQP